MKLYILKIKSENPTEDYGWDCMYTAVVEAKNPTSARKMVSEDASDEGKVTWLNSRLSSCKELKISGKERIVITDVSNG